MSGSRVIGDGEGHDEHAAIAEQWQAHAQELLDQSRREEALAAAEHATALSAWLVDNGDDARRPELAISLLNTAQINDELGRIEEARARTQMAVDHWTSLDDVIPDHARPSRAHALTELAERLSKLARHRVSPVTNMGPHGGGLARN